MVTDNKRQASFLAAYRLTGNITRAAAASEQDRRQHQRWMKNEEYRALFEEAKLDAADFLEAEARRRATEGLQRLKFHQGQVIQVPSGEWTCDVGHIGPQGDRGPTGWECPICELPQHPHLVPYVEHEYSDTLLIFLLKGAMPDKYRERAEVKHDFSNVSDAELIQRAASLLGGVDPAGADDQD